MNPVLRIALVYFFLMLLFRVAGRRTMSDLSPFDFVLLLIISELVQQAVVADDPSLTNAFILCASLVALDIGLSLLKLASPRLERVLDGSPAPLVQHGKLIEPTLRAMRLDEGDILSAARTSQGLERIDQIRLAVVETNGEISVVPEPDARIRPGPAA
jgi:uncharacterized membrane protein YcaP (DUF421 family)